MATFAKSTFNATRYAASRPTYPRSLFETIFNYHEKSLALSGCRADWNHALDLGCGTGQATSELLRSAGVQEGDEMVRGFDRVTGLDPSGKMISEAKAFAATLGAGASALKFVQSPAENLSKFRDGSVDMVIAAQAAHWFDWARLWPELSRVLRHGGTVAFWVYSEFRLPEHPQLTPLITEYAQGSDRNTSLGPHWEPGRKILANHLLDIPEPESGWDDFTRVFFSGEYYPDLPHPHLAPIMRKRMTWGGAGLHGYLRTFSALHRFHEQFPEDLRRGDGDIATRFLRTLMQNAGVPAGEAGEAQEVEVEWSLALVVARKELDARDPWLVREEVLQSRIEKLQADYRAEFADAPVPSTVEEMGERMDRWIAVQETVKSLVDEDLAGVPEEVDPAEEEGRERYVMNLEDMHDTVTWHVSFRRAFDTALQLAYKADREAGGDIAGGVTLWLDLMAERVKEVAPVVEADEEGVVEGALGLTRAQIESLTEEQMEAFDEALALGNIVHVIQELASAVGHEPISDLVKEMYISASSEVAREVGIDRP
ncbi:hypothetical protein B0H15DRAFT_948348 [Mycena belliarum]|uniref:Methyltransferase type 11 domain-containing protein n=1 Tax=Mycena belliarum TaxID=1033014 RepID=A0AAD6U596_9AGAR|nr:hypothetical protein B0H15DRAFT_948348 [Mycena belliae]